MSHVLYSITSNLEALRGKTVFNTYLSFGRSNKKNKLKDCSQCVLGLAHGMSIAHGMVKKRNASDMLVAPRISECFGMPWSDLVSYTLPFSAIVCLGLL